MATKLISKSGTIYAIMNGVEVEVSDQQQARNLIKDSNNVNDNVLFQVPDYSVIQDCQWQFLGRGEWHDCSPLASYQFQQDGVETRKLDRALLLPEVVHNSSYPKEFTKYELREAVSKALDAGDRLLDDYPYDDTEGRKKVIDDYLKSINL
jgi:hypothetical protein